MGRALLQGTKVCINYWGICSRSYGTDLCDIHTEHLTEYIHGKLAELTKSKLTYVGTLQCTCCPYLRCCLSQFQKLWCPCDCRNDDAHTLNLTLYLSVHIISDVQAKPCLGYLILKLFSLSLFQSVVEKCTYAASKGQENFTVIEKQAWINSKMGFGLKRPILEFSLKRYKSNQQKATLGLEHVINDTEPKNLRNLVKHSREVISERAKQSKDIITQKAKQATELDKVKLNCQS